MTLIWCVCVLENIATRARVASFFGSIEDELGVQLLFYGRCFFFFFDLFESSRKFYCDLQLSLNVK